MRKQPTGHPIRVLIVEDSRAQRELLVGLVQASGILTVAGTASDGQDAVAAALRLRPDVIAMDIHLPTLDGYDATRQIMQRCPTPIVLVSSSNGDAAQRSLLALAAGALTVIRKPGGGVLTDTSPEREAFLTTLRIMAGVPVVTRYAPRALPELTGAAGATNSSPASDVAPLVLAIAASTGGPAALQTVLTGLGNAFPLPILVVQHIARGFVAAMVEWLNGAVPLTVCLASHGEALLPGHAYIAPEGFHLLARERGRAALLRDAEDGTLCPSADLLFESLSRSYAARALGLVLTGMGNDGTRGLLALRAAGGQTLAQDQASCVVYGMPRAAVEAGAINQSVALGQIAETIIEKLRAP